MNYHKFHPRLIVVNNKISNNKQKSYFLNNNFLLKFINIKYLKLDTKLKIIKKITQTNNKNFYKNNKKKNLKLMKILKL